MGVRTEGDYLKMTKKRFEKIVEWKYYPTPFETILLPFFLMIYILSSIWHHNLLFDKAMSCFVIIIAFCLVSLAFQFMASGRKVYWEEVK